jgi:hypothetical protein
VYLGGDGIDAEAIERFAFDLKERHRLKQERRQSDIAPSVQRAEASLAGNSGIFGFYPEERRAARD